MKDNQPSFGNGKICYLEIPAIDIEVSAAFYSKTFGWEIRRKKEDSLSFDDGVGQVSGMWVLGMKPMTEPGIIISIMVDDAKETGEFVTANGGKILHSSILDSGEVIMHFKDPAGNFMGIYQHRHK